MLSSRRFSWRLFGISNGTETEAFMRPEAEASLSTSGRSGPGTNPSQDDEAVLKEGMDEVEETAPANFGFWFDGFCGGFPSCGPYN